jgi:hypothetical protein
MSAWYLFSALGFYPLQMGSPTYAIGSPLFKKATVNLENGKKLVINAPNNSASNVYVQQLRVNGQRWDKTYLPHDLLAKGAVLDFTMGPNPSNWGTGPAAAPPSNTTGDAAPAPARDVTKRAIVDVPALFDDTSDTRTDVSTVEMRFSGTREKVTSYTLTSAETPPDASGWALKASYDGQTWTTIDQRAGEAFPWRLQTRPFTIAKPGRYSHYRLEFTGPARLAEVELLAAPEPACTSTISGTHAGPLTVSTGLTCLAPGSKVTGPVSVAPGAALFASDASIGGPLAATGARSLVLLHTSVAGPAFVTGTAGELSLEDSSVGGALLLTANTGGTVVAGDTVQGGLSCVLNTPPPANQGLTNRVSGGKAGQCAAL